MASRQRPVLIDGARLTSREIREVARGEAPVRLAPESREGAGHLGRDRENRGRGRGVRPDHRRGRQPGRPLDSDLDVAERLLVGLASIMGWWAPTQR
jgi:hypothetical protein